MEKQNDGFDGLREAVEGIINEVKQEAGDVKKLSAFSRNLNKLRDWVNMQRFVPGDGKIHPDEMLNKMTELEQIDK